MNKREKVQQISLEYGEGYNERYKNDPVLWIEEVIGVHLWSKQKEIVQSVFDNRRTVVRSCHGIGKTFLSACCVLAFLYTEIPSKVITTAPTWGQVQDLLWREIGYLFKNFIAPKGFDGIPLKTALNIEDDWFATGISPKDEVNTQGYHQKNILVVVDECPGLRPEIINALESLATSGNAHALWIGNPTEPSGHFYEAFTDPSFAKFKVSAFDSPNFTNEQVPNELKSKLISKEWVEEKRHSWGEDSPLYVSKILAEFPAGGTNQIISLALCEEAKNRHIEHLPNEPIYLGVDPARLGDDSTIYMVCKGQEITDIYEQNKTRITEVARFTEMLYEEHKVEEIRMDSIGVGSGAVDILYEKGLPVYEINNASKDVNEDRKYFNVRAENWFGLEEWLRTGKIPDDEMLIRDITTPRYKIRPADNLLQVELKDEIISRLGRSPDRGDAATMATPRSGLARKFGRRGKPMADSRSWSSNDLDRMIVGDTPYYTGIY